MENVEKERITLLLTSAPLPSVFRKSVILREVKANTPVRVGLRIFTEPGISLKQYNVSKLVFPVGSRVFSLYSRCHTSTFSLH